MILLLSRIQRVLSEGTERKEFYIEEPWQEPVLFILKVVDVSCRQVGCRYKHSMVQYDDRPM